jgi:hypothetical protein
VRRAQRALIEIQHRRAAEERHAADEAARYDDLARWHADDTSSATTAAGTARQRVEDTAAEDSGQVMERGAYDD